MFQGPPPPMLELHCYKSGGLPIEKLLTSLQPGYN